ncbi:stage V sporulation protein AA [Chengkuizengella sp. 2205SS18-9]|uniref:Stage V sporulation protein AA n=1 Tax=Chengkuizengella axinellae TaxID=3064388 RepID=A0ABT9IX96_9BACL|nr:stage V sporulation protein AA [Chengkuizengella sp. 2205SS18-9]MDP5273737.1 stage V sporulation protein AA [Chengkuizengella sp. 2205SS18-9]
MVISIDQQIIYLRLRKSIRLDKGKPIHLGQIAQIIIDPKWENTLKQLIIVQPKDERHLVIDLMMIIRKVTEVLPEVTIEYFGEPHVFVEFEENKPSPNFVLIALVWLLLFVGSGLAIMNFHADVSMEEVHQKIYTFVTGKEKESPLLLQIPYSLGLGIGMILFFNRLFKKKFSEEPSPLELEMYLYKENMNQFLITKQFQKNDKRSGSDDDGTIP